MQGFSVLFEGNNLQRLLLGLLVSARIALAAVLLSAVFGVALGIIQTRRNRPVNLICGIYLESMRIIPVLVWLFIFYFGLARNFHINLSGEAASILVFTLWGSAEMGDIVRGAITSLPVHQTESAHALGLSNAQVYLHILIPQVIRRLLPAFINLATRMIKTTSLVVLIGVVEVLKVGQQIIEANFFTNSGASFWVYLLIFFLYFALCAPISHVSKRLEQRWQS
jgi:polar amino acid transport system permease protein